MFAQSQFSDQKNQSGFKQGINYNETITNMTIKMIKKLKISTEKNEILYNDKSITLIHLVARNEISQEQDKKGYILVNDDSGCQQLFLLFSEGPYTREWFQLINTTEPKTSYFQFLLRARINKDQICLDIMNVKKIVEVGYVISHILNIIQQTMKANQSNNIHFVQTNTQIDEEQSQQKSTQQSLSDRILGYIKAQTNQQGYISIAQQSIVNEFSSIADIQNIKQSLRQLLDGGNIQQGNGVNTYKLVD